MSKLGPHLLGGSSDAMKLVMGAKSPVVKFTDNFGQVDTMAALDHKPLIVGRRVVAGEIDPNFHADRGDDPRQIASWYLLTYYDRDITLNPNVKAWEGPNEPHPNSPKAMTWYAKFEAARVEMLSTMGKKAVVGNFSVGTPEVVGWYAWADFEDALAAIRVHDGYLGLHEYAEPCRASNGNDFYFYRFRKAPRDVKKIITEFGADTLPPIPEDGTLPRVCPEGKPWMDLFGGNPVAYAEMLTRYDREVASDADLIGATIFTYGGGGGQWDRHNVDGRGVTDEILARIVVTDPPDPNGYRVTALMLNVRAWPWVSDIVPDLVGRLQHNAFVRVRGVYKLSGQVYGWANIGTSDDLMITRRWVNMKYLGAVGR